MLYELCYSRNIGCQRIGKLVVPRDPLDQQGLEQLFQQGTQNGVEDLHFLSRRELESWAPALAVKAAFHSASSGIVDSHGVMKCLEAEAQSRGAVVSYGSEIVGIQRRTRDYLVEVREGDGELSQIAAQIVINSAGLHADKIASMAGIDIEKAGYVIQYVKGEYARVRDLRHIPPGKLVYPTVNQSGRDVHLVYDLQGRAKLGTLNTCIDKIVDYRMLQSDPHPFYQEISSCMPLLQPDDLSLDTCGIAPKFGGLGGPPRDYLIRDEKDRGLPGLINLIGIGSPGLTSCLAIAQQVRQLL